MISLHILISRHFETVHYSKLWLDSIYPTLSKKFDVKITWFFYGPKKINLITEKHENVIYFQDFDDANQVIDKIKPDIVIESEFPTAMDMAFYAAAKNRVPFIRKTSTSLKLDLSLKDTFDRLPTLFRSTKTEKNLKDNPFMPRQRFFLKKLIFLVKTLSKSKLTFIKKLKIFQISLKYVILPEAPFINSEVESDLEIINSESMIEQFLQKGYSRSNLIVCGNPIFDSLIQKQKSSYKKPIGKIKILCVPTHSWGKENDLTIKNILENTGNNNNLSVSFKLHPTSHNYEKFSNSIFAIDPSIKIFQNGTVEKYVDDSDVVIFYGRMTSALIYPLIFKKPLIFCDFFDSSEGKDLNDISFICKDPKNLQKIIFNSIESNSEKYDAIQNYLNNFCNKEKSASNCIMNALENLLQK